MMETRISASDPLHDPCFRHHIAKASACEVQNDCYRGCESIATIFYLVLSTCKLRISPFSSNITIIATVFQDIDGI